MKKRLLSILLTACLLMGLLPTAALAADPAEPADFIHAPLQAIAALNAAKTPGAEDSTWEDNTLTLRGVDFTATGTTAMKLPADAKIVLADGTTNTITGGNTQSGNCYGIYAEGALTIEGEAAGTGTLTVTGGDVSGENSGDYFESCGIYADDSVTISGGIVYAEGGAVTTETYRGTSCGIAAYNSVTVSGSADVTALGGDAGCESYGISAYGYDEENRICYGDVIISGGTVTATAGTASESSDGIYAGKSVSVSDGIVEATGGTSDYYSDGICVYTCDVTISGGTVTATGGATTAETDYDSSCGISASAGVTITGGTVQAEGGAANYESYGIFAYGHDLYSGEYYGEVAITGGSVTATSGTTNGYSSGIYAYISMTVDGGSVCAGSGAANDESSGIFASTMTVKGGSVSAGSGAANYESFGILASIMTVHDGTVTATGGAAQEKSCGIYIDDRFTVNGGSVTATGGDAEIETESSGIFASTMIVNDGIVIATGGDAETAGYGILASTMTVNDGSVTATGGDVMVYSYGINARDGMTISGGHLTAQTLAETATDKAALKEEPILDENYDYYWRTDAADSYTKGNFVWKEAPYDTYVEITDAPFYTITLNANGGTVEPSSLTTGDGWTLTSLPTPTRKGYSFDGWFTEETGGVEVTTATTFDKDTTIYAHWKARSSGSSGIPYSITVESAKNGDVTASHKTASKGTTVTITVEPDKGFALKSLTVTDKSGDEIKLTDKGDGKFTFKMPAGKVTVEATFVKEAARDNTIVLTLGSTTATVFGRTVVNDVAPVARNNRTLLPIRFVAEALGAQVDWNADLQKVTISKADLLIEIYLGQTTAYVNGSPVVLDVAAFAENNRTYLPLRFVAEALGAEVLWDAPTQTITIIPA